MRSSRSPSSPPSAPSPYRQLGSGGQSPVRVQMIIALVAGLVLVAVPLYLWRRPEPGEQSRAAEPQADAAAALSGAVPYLPLLDAGAQSPQVKLGPFQTIRCQDPGPGKTPPERCDHVTYFEDALSRAIRENALCAPSTKEGASVSFVLEIDFRRKQSKIYPGKSSSLPKAQTKELFRCVERAMPKPEWGSVPHQHSRYVVNVVANYPPSDLF